MNIAIVDDDVEMVEFLKKLLDWNAYHCNIVATAYSGESLLQKIGKTPIDILFTDITMPGLDGYALAEAVRKQNPSVKIVFLTCHEEIDFARDAIKLGVTDYLIKYSLQKEELTNCLLRIQELIDNETKQVNPSDEIIKSEIFEYALFEKKCDIKKIEDYWGSKFFYLMKVVSIYSADDCNLANIQTSPSWSQNRWVTEVDKLLKNYLSFEKNSNDSKKSFLIFSNSDSVFILASSRSLLNTASDELLQWGANIGCDFCCAMEKNALSFDNLPSIVKSLKSINDDFFYQKGGVYLYQGKSSYIDLPRELEGSLFCDFRLNFVHQEQFKSYFSRLKQELLIKKYEPSSVRRFFKTCISFVYAQTLHFSTVSTEIRLTNFSFEFCCDALLAQIESYLRCCPETINKGKNPDVQTILDFVDAHLDIDINLNSLADLVNKSSAYTSRLFTYQTGESLSSYIIKKRVQRATYLLMHTNLTIDEIALKIGIENKNYFYRFYKRETGKTPGEIRNEE